MLFRSSLLVIMSQAIFQPETKTIRAENKLYFLGEQLDLKGKITSSQELGILATKWIDYDLNNCIEFKNDGDLKATIILDRIGLKKRRNQKIDYLLKD